MCASFTTLLQFTDVPVLLMHAYPATMLHFTDIRKIHHSSLGMLLLNGCLDCKLKTISSLQVVGFSELLFYIVDVSSTCTKD